MPDKKYSITYLYYMFLAEQDMEKLDMNTSDTFVQQKTTLFNSFVLQSCNYYISIDEVEI